jgi:predicted nucleotidyltransferase
MGKTRYTVDEIAKIVTPVAEEYGVERVYLFGSYARGVERPESDIDFRIDGGKLRTLFRLAEFYEELREHLNVPIDVLTTETLDDDFLSYIRDEELLLYAAR